MKIRKSTSKLAKILGIGIGTLALATGCKCYEPKPKAPTETELKGQPACILTYNVERGYPRGRELFIKDLDGNDTADIIYFGGAAFWVAEEHREEHEEEGWTRIMTPEIRRAATDALKTEHKLVYLLAHKEYEELKAEQSKK